mmetsp:Transcript_91255/g.230126  ORF Transcript_91255/g.230126 Transcript_91255/m.230126 type:complete len:266 (-) Transcript_91255:55-852(-)
MFSNPGERTLPTRMDDGVGKGALSGLSPDLLHSEATMFVISPSTDRPARADLTDNSTFCGVSSSPAPRGARPGAAIGVINDEPAIGVQVEEPPTGVRPEELIGETSSRFKAGALRRPSARLKFTPPTRPALGGAIPMPKRLTGVSGRPGVDEGEPVDVPRLRTSKQSNVSVPLFGGLVAAAAAAAAHEAAQAAAGEWGEPGKPMAGLRYAPAMSHAPNGENGDSNAPGNPPAAPAPCCCCCCCCHLHGCCCSCCMFCRFAASWGL